MRDVAELAKVGIKTVSRVVNEESGVSDATERVVQRAIRELGFRPNANARSLRQGSSDTVGLLVEDVSEPFQAALIRSIEATVNSRGKLLFTASSLGDQQREESLVNAFTDRQVAGLLAIPSGAHQPRLAADSRPGPPVVFIDRPSDLEADVVMSDNLGGSRSAVEHLIQQGHTRIAFIGDRRELFTTDQRYRGYSQALHEHGLKLDPSLVRFAGLDATGTEQAVRSVLSMPTPATALFTCNSWISVRALRALLGAEDPPAFVGFDDFSEADLFATPLTVVAQDPLTIGRLAAEILLHRLEGDASPTQRIQVGTRLIIRGSGERRATHPRTGQTGP